MPLNEIDSEIRERDGYTARALPCPDGMTRIVLMPRWYWDNYDWLTRNGHFEPDHVFTWILEHVTTVEWPGTEYTLDERLSMMLHESVFRCICSLFPFYLIGHPDNDNTRPAGATDTASATKSRRKLRLYLGRGGRIGQLPF